MRTNAQRISEWMTAAGQDVPPAPTALDDATANLRRLLIAEEAEEACEILESWTGEQEQQAALAKELGDILVVTYGAMVAAGLDADQIFGIVMDENDAKIAHAQKNEHGKLVVPDFVKARLKQATRARLLAVVGP